MGDQTHGGATPEAILEELGLAGIPSQEVLLQEIEREILYPKDIIPEHWLSEYKLHWDHELSIPSLFTLEPSVPSTVLTFQRSGLNGRIVGYSETNANRVLATGLTSTSLSRAPAPPSTFVRGKSGYMPFLPGGLEDAVVGTEETEEGSEKQKGLRTIPPGFSRGLRLPGEEDDEVPNDELLTTEVDGLAKPPLVEAAEPAYNEPAELPIASGEEFALDSLLPADRTFLYPESSKKIPRKPAVAKREWAHVVDIDKPLKNFHELVPDMAHQYPFELDTFQKEAVYHLEMGDSVFVAAHTSAGKTVVAEYAIALAAKHMTRAIYTSPIKALSNQKFRDFKQTFDPATVGILTGDVQINPEGSCLIMTTEILRSMLYKGADLIRDVEFVIFDEVHYVNDLE
ncbi:hypothetical protein FRB90_003977, partial [Tulasnella sp. 427]